MDNEIGREIAHALSHLTVQVGRLVDVRQQELNWFMTTNNFVSKDDLTNAVTEMLMAVATNQDDVKAVVALGESIKALRVKAEAINASPPQQS